MMRRKLRREPIDIPIDQFRKRTKSIRELERTQGKIGGAALPVFLAQASLFLRRPYAEIEGIPRKRGKQGSVFPGKPKHLPEGCHVLVARDTDKFMLLDGVGFKNAGKERTVLLLEPIGKDGKSQGFLYVQLDPEDSFLFEHNNPVILVVVVVVGVGGVIVAIEAGADYVEKWVTAQHFFCRLVEAVVLDNECLGKCAAGLRCWPTRMKPSMLYGTEPGACGCV